MVIHTAKLSYMNVDSMSIVKCIATSIKRIKFA